MTMTTGRRTRQPATTIMRRWDPVRDLEDVYDRMGQLMQDFFQEAAQVAMTGRMPAWPVPADIEETDDAIIVEFDLPSVRPEDFNLQLRDSELYVFGEIKEREHKGVMRRKARRVGQFEHMVALPGDVNPDKVDAKLSDGVLTVRVAKKAGTQPRRIEVKT